MNMFSYVFVWQRQNGQLKRNIQKVLINDVTIKLYEFNFDIQFCYIKLILIDNLLLLRPDLYLALTHKQ